MSCVEFKNIFLTNESDQSDLFSLSLSTSSIDFPMEPFCTLSSSHDVYCGRKIRTVDKDVSQDFVIKGRTAVDLFSVDA